MMLAVVDYGAGNIRSVTNALRFLGQDCSVVQTPEQLAEADRIILPGVGAFGDSMEKLRARGLQDALQREVIENGKPFLGICLGMQVILSRSFEYGEHTGLGWFQGDVQRFRATEKAPALRVPHIGWNSVRFTRSDPLFDGLGEEQDFYFVHSYHCAPSDSTVILGASDYGAPFAAIVGRDNIYGMQFHPEKSQRAGIMLLRNWLDIVDRC